MTTRTRSCAIASPPFDLAEALHGLKAAPPFKVEGHVEPRHRVCTHRSAAGYAFAASGVTSDDPRQAPRPGELSCTTTSSTTVKCANKHNDHGRLYKYTLHVVNPSGQPLTIDPFINNR